MQWAKFLINWSTNQAGPNTENYVHFVLPLAGLGCQIQKQPSVPDIMDHNLWFMGDWLCSQSYCWLGKIKWKCVFFHLRHHCVIFSENLNCNPVDPKSPTNRSERIKGLSKEFYADPSDFVPKLPFQCADSISLWWLRSGGAGKGEYFDEWGKWRRWRGQLIFRSPEIWQFWDKKEDGLWQDTSQYLGYRLDLPFPSSTNLPAKLSGHWVRTGLHIWELKVHSPFRQREVSVSFLIHPSWLVKPPSRVLIPPEWSYFDIQVLAAPAVYGQSQSLSDKFYDVMHILLDSRITIERQSLQQPGGEIQSEI